MCTVPSLFKICRDSGLTTGWGSSEEVEIPVIIISNKVKGEVYAELIYQEDVAPTVCALLGLPFMSYMTGSVIDFPFNINKKVSDGPCILAL